MNFRKVVILILGAAVIAGFSTLAAAQQMYRCGNNYQDSPCEPGRETKRLGSATRAVGVATTPSAATAVAAGADAGYAQCASWGEASTKVVWAREAGMTIDRQLSEANSDLQRRVIASVYQKRGSAPVIRAQIEAECRQEQDKRKQLQALAEAAAQVKAGLPGDPTPAQAPVVAQTQGSGSEGGARLSAAGEAAAHKATCDRLSQSMQSIREDQRAGGSAATMERLNQQRRNMEAVLRTNGCS
jgi:hypothetical protein